MMLLPADQRFGRNCVCMCVCKEKREAHKKVKSLLIFESWCVSYRHIVEATEKRGPVTGSKQFLKN